ILLLHLHPSSRLLHRSLRRNAHLEPELIPRIDSVFDADQILEIVLVVVAQQFLERFLRVGFFDWKGTVREVDERSLGIAAHAVAESAHPRHAPLRDGAVLTRIGPPRLVLEHERLVAPEERAPGLCRLVPDVAAEAVEAEIAARGLLWIRTSDVICE